MSREPLSPRFARAVALALAGGALAAALSGAPLFAEGAAPTLRAETEYPLRGEPVTIRLAAPDGGPLAGVPISAEYRPNSETAHAEPLGSTGADGTLSWVPADAGVVTLRAGGGDGEPPIATAQVAVRFGAFPAVGLLVMVAAAILLFGGALLGFRLLLGPPPAAPVIEPPST